MISTTSVFKFNLKQQKIIFLFNKINIFILIILYSGFLVIFNILPLDIFNKIFYLNNDKNFKNILFFCLIICIFGLVFSFLSIINIWLINYIEFIDNKIQLIILNILSLNILNLINNIVIYSCETKWKNSFFFETIKRKKKLINIGIRKWETFDFVLISIFVSLTLILSYLEIFLPNLPYGGGVAIKYIPIMLVSFFCSVFAGFLTGSISSLLSLLFISSKFIISPWSYLFDYFIPMIVPSIVGFMKFNIKNNKWYITYINYVIICFSVIILIYFSQVFSGIIIWTILFPDSIWLNYSYWLYSIVYNFIHIFIFTYPVIQIVVPIILRNLYFVFSKRYYLR